MMNVDGNVKKKMMKDVEIADMVVETIVDIVVVVDLVMVEVTSVVAEAVVNGDW